MTTPRTNWLQVVRNLRPHRSGGKFSPHKPLLVLLLLGRARDGHPNEFRFKEVEKTLPPWIQAITGRRGEALLPFWHLQSSAHVAFWNIGDKEKLQHRHGKRRPTTTSLRDVNPAGVVDPGMWQAVSTDSALRNEVASEVIEAYFELPDRAKVRRLTGFAE